MTIPVIDRLSEVAADCDAVILDVWGVLHDGVAAYGETIAALGALRAQGKRTLLLSNAPRRSSAVEAVLDGMGIGRPLYDHVLTSGEAVHRDLAARTDPFFAALGRRLFHLGADADRNVFDGLDYAAVALDEADFILNTGPAKEEALADHLPVLEAAAARGLPMVCANPDRVVMVGDRRWVCAGALAEHYETIGGRVAWRGKPDPAIYATALALLGATPDRVVAVGDALHTDIAGAASAGLRSVLVTQGIHAADLGIVPGTRPDPARVTDLCRRHGLVPAATIATLRW